MEHKTFKMEDVAISDTGIFTGYLAIFNNKDLGGDIIQPGAFAKTLKEKKNKIPLLDAHNSEKRLGYLEVEEDDKGLKITKGTLNLKKQLAQEAYADLLFYQENKMPLGLSIGYDVIKKHIEYAKDNSITRILQELALWEGSIVTFPMNPKARVSNVKDFSALTKDEAVAIVTALKNTLSLNEIKALLGLEVAETQTEPQSHSVVDFSWLKQYHK